MEVLSVDMMGQVDIFGHYCNAFCMDGAQMGVFQKASQVVFHCFL